ncbi:16S rRNA (cytidine(1402)-2'-O)-methyltransferase [Pelagicoccus sp. SDUM812002]|uniref:16S rRNA (cytidine(1402)-2'-O)-methyltransferase n=1 Tax=Pelagicoccus sp. SDUM812002 TaxID=3041266 RepID=UPI00280D154C|nr:16S rRNA (cytidine(1402)-2'-O)-methyltransferase [Pelagicoccus sp. SDUM812002]MDQ8186896.1 16S rRNA (cytidine(1402)-2'-O)-methyltransferase [Pelagicoccus sp. SDUM812002]
MSSDNPSLTPEPGHLYVIATPIGNLADITERALSLLSKVDSIACEDTRTTGTMLTRLKIRRPLLAYHDHNEKHAASSIVAKLHAGESVALVSDAGTPAISDPGFRVARECQRLGLPVVPIPGACAVTSLLSVSGLPTDAFFFAGFLPPKSAARRRFFEEYRNFKHTIALYESTHRIEKMTAELEDVLGPERVVCIGRELTKKFETIRSGPISQIREQMATASKKGEFVVLIAPENYEL